jgi:Lhr-like helicase
VNEGDYVRVTGSYSVETCTIGLWSSATVSQLEEVTDFLKGQKDLKPFPLEVLNADTLGEMTPSSAR